MSDQEKTPDKDKQLAELKARAEKWERLHTESTIRRELLAAAERGGAFYGPQLLPWLEKDAKTEEVKGQFVVYVQGTDENGKKIRRTPDEAVANMKRQSDFANLFKETMVTKPTLATLSAPITPDKIDWNNLSHPEYLKIREEHPEWLGLKPLPKKGR